MIKFILSIVMLIQIIMSLATLFVFIGMILVPEEWIVSKEDRNELIKYISIQILCTVLNTLANLNNLINISYFIFFMVYIVVFFEAVIIIVRINDEAERRHGRK